LRKNGYGDYRKDVFVVPHNGQCFYITYPDYRICESECETPEQRESHYQYVCDYNIRELNMLQVGKKLAQKNAERPAAEVRQTETPLDRVNRTLTEAHNRDVAFLLRRQEERERQMLEENRRRQQEHDAAERRQEEREQRIWANFDEGFYYMNPPQQ